MSSQNSKNYVFTSREKLLLNQMLAYMIERLVYKDLQDFLQGLMNNKREVTEKELEQIAMKIMLMREEQ